MDLRTLKKSRHYCCKIFVFCKIKKFRLSFFLFFRLLRLHFTRIKTSIMADNKVLSVFWSRKKEEEGKKRIEETEQKIQGWTDSLVVSWLPNLEKLDKKLSLAVLFFYVDPLFFMHIPCRKPKNTQI